MELINRKSQLGDNRRLNTKVDITPLQSMFDEDVTVRVSGLYSTHSYTVIAFCRPAEKSVLFYSFAHYVSNDDGVVDITQMASNGGTYVGIEPMGLIWSMVPCPEGDRGRNIYHFRFPKPKFNIEFAIHPDHLENDVIMKILISDDFSKIVVNAIARQTIERFSLSPTTERFEVQVDRLRGTLFIPRGQGPYLGVLELYGLIYGMHCELRASILAAHGYITFALAFMNYKDLPDDDHLDLEYFLEAVEFLSSHPLVRKEGIAIVGHCYGGTIGYHLASVHPKVLAVATTASCSYLFHGKMKFRNKDILTYRDDSRMTLSNGLEVHCHVFPLIDAYTVPIERSREDARFLIIHGEDDTVVYTGHAHCLARRLQRAGRRGNYRLLTYPGAGHSLYLPNGLFVRQSGRTPGTKELLLHGGYKHLHERAQRAAWKEIVGFLHQVQQSLSSKAKL